MAPGSTDTEPVQDAPINEVGDIQPTTSHISSDTKSDKTNEIPPPSYCTRLSHPDETQNAKPEPANPHDSNPPSPTRMCGATASQRSLKPKQSVVSKPLCDAQGAQSAPKHLISRQMQCATGARAAYTTQIVRRYHVRCVSRLARPEVIVLFGTLSENTASLGRLPLKQLGELDWRCTVPLRRWPDDCMPTLWRIRVQPRAVFKRNCPHLALFLFGILFVRL